MGGSALNASAARAVASAPLILTATIERAAAERFEAERRRYYPPDRNLVRAHVTLFHALPPSSAADVTARCRMIARGTAPIAAEATGLFSLGRGVAYRIHAPELERLRAELADAWWTLLSAQDQARIRPHVTIQNKAEPAAAKALLASLQPAFAPIRFAFVGLELWRYVGGPWDPAGAFRFAG